MTHHLRVGLEGSVDARMVTEESLATSETQIVTSFGRRFAAFIMLQEEWGSDTAGVQLTPEDRRIKRG